MMVRIWYNGREIAYGDAKLKGVDFLSPQPKAEKVRMAPRYSKGHCAVFAVLLYCVIVVLSVVF